MFSGQKHGFRWFEWGNDDPGPDIAWLLEYCPVLVTSRFLVNTSLDSGPLCLSERMIADGWRRRGTVAISPRIKSICEVPRDTYDEWYVFASEPERPEALANAKVDLSGGPHQYVNFCGFSLNKPDHASFAEGLWEQLLESGAESYFSEGQNLICITRLPEAIQMLSAWKPQVSGGQRINHG